MRSVALACLAPLAAATKNLAGLSYASAIPKEYLAQDCEYPAYFTIQNFTTFTPSASNQTEVHFGCTCRLGHRPHNHLRSEFDLDKPRR
ncbi:hypothetical protein diail_10297 [Diaporthe ilicicola]|nr:hypothetical protein diail_10297 [Diaporthe ilicicola]